MSVYHPIVLAGDGDLISDPMNPWLRIIATLQTRDSDMNIHMRTARCKIVNCVFLSIRTVVCYQNSEPVLRPHPFMHTGPSQALHNLCPVPKVDPAHSCAPARPWIGLFWFASALGRLSFENRVMRTRFHLTLPAPLLDDPPIIFATIRSGSS